MSGKSDKRELIQRICQLSRGEKPEFLANFTEEELSNYLQNLKERVELKELAVSRSA